MRTSLKVLLRLLAVGLFIGGLGAFYLWGSGPDASVEKRLWGVGVMALAVGAVIFTYFQGRYPQAEQRRARYVQVFGRWAGRLMDWNERLAQRQAASLRQLQAKEAEVEAKAIAADKANQALLKRTFPPEPH
jgi:hypothetical protein